MSRFTRYNAYSPYCLNHAAQAYFARKALVTCGLSLPPINPRDARIDSNNPVEAGIAAQKMLQNTYGLPDEGPVSHDDPYSLDPRRAGAAAAYAVATAVPDNIYEAERAEGVRP